MSHDDPLARDATKKAPERGGRSFPRTGPFPGLARMRARWPACSLAAAVLLGGRRVLADDGVFVHIDSPVPATLEEYRSWAGRVGGRVVGGSNTRPVCNSPCDDVITGVYSKRYVITGSFTPSSTFYLPDVTGGVTITVQPGTSHGRLVGGYLALCGGVFSVGNPGVLLYLLGKGSNAVMSGAGIGFMVAGGVAAIYGAVAVATGTTKIKLRKSGEGPVGRAAPLKPRYWMGEF